jgi:hypothetical protein
VSDLTVTGALARAVSKLRAVASYQRTAGAMSDAVDDDGIADALEVELEELASVPNVGTIEPGALVSFLRGLPAEADASRAWIRKLRSSLEHLADFANSGARAVGDHEYDAGGVISGFDRMLAEIVAAEDRAAERIAAFLDVLAGRSGRYLVTPDAVATLRAAASDILDGRWRRP